MRRRSARFLALLLSGALLAPAAARAADPIMPLADVRSGMRCTGLSVIRGTQITSFDVEVLDVVAEQAVDPQPRILVRVSGPVAEQGGIAAGFSGSPVYCPDARGTRRNIGALAYGLGQYGDTVGLATPIELMLGDRGARAAHTRVRPDVLRAARPLAAPLTVGGVSPELGRMLAEAGRRAGRTVRAGPAGPVGGLPRQELRPGAAVVAGLATGDLSVGALGTVTYADGNRVWAFGHPFEGLGARRLLLQDAYVYGVIYNPVNAGGVMSYKLGAGGNVLGTLTDDELDAVIGRVGLRPPLTDLRVVARDPTTGRRVSLTSKLADETEVDRPSDSPLSLLVPVALFQANAITLRSTPPKQSASLCMRMTLAGRAAPLRFCNRYVGSVDGESVILDNGTSGSGALLRLLADASHAVGLVEAYQGRPLRVARVRFDLRARRGLALARLERAAVSSPVRAGDKIRVNLRVRAAEGQRERVGVTVAIPRDTPAGSYTLRFAGSRPDDVDDEFVEVLADVLAGEGESPAEEPIRSVDELAQSIAEIERFDGVTVRLRGAEGDRVIRRFTDRARRLSGRATVRIRVEE